MLLHNIKKIIQVFTQVQLLYTVCYLGELFRLGCLHLRYLISEGKV